MHYYLPTFYETIIVNVLLKGTIFMTEIQTHTLLLTTPAELGSGDLDRSATTRHMIPKSDQYNNLSLLYLLLVLSKVCRVS